MGWSLTPGTWRRERLPVPKENITTRKIAPFAAPSATKVGERDPRGTPQSGGPASSFAFSRCSRTWLGCLCWSGAFSLLSSPRDFGRCPGYLPLKLPASERKQTLLSTHLACLLASEGQAAGLPTLSPTLPADTCTHIHSFGNIRTWKDLQ